MPLCHIVVYTGARYLYDTYVVYVHYQTKETRETGPYGGIRFAIDGKS